MTTILTLSAFAQDKEPLTWEQQREIYEFPAWYTEGRFGIWVHWGAQTEPEEGGGWYARHMYMQDVGRETWGKKAYSYHNKKYGHPSEKVLQQNLWVNWGSAPDPGDFFIGETDSKSRWGCMKASGGTLEVTTAGRIDSSSCLVSLFVFPLE